MDKKMLFKQVALILLALIIVGVPGCVKNATVKINELHSRLEKGWNVILPDDTRLIYDIENRGWRGDGVEYFIAETNDVQDYEGFDFSDGPNESFEKEVNGRLALFEDEVTIDTKYLPDWERSYSWISLSNDRDDFLYIWHYTEETLLYIFIFYL